MKLWCSDNWSLNSESEDDVCVDELTPPPASPVPRRQVRQPVDPTSYLEDWVILEKVSDVQ